MGEGQGDHRSGEEFLVWGGGWGTIGRGRSFWCGEEGGGGTGALWGGQYMYNNVMLEFNHLDRQGKTKG